MIVHSHNYLDDPKAAKPV